MLAADRADLSSGEVVLGNVDTAVDARDPGLVGGVVVGGRLQHDIPARPPLDVEASAGLTALEQPARKIRAARERREDLSGGAAEGAVAGHVPRKGRGDERGR